MNIPELLRRAANIARRCIEDGHTFYKRDAEAFESAAEQLEAELAQRGPVGYVSPNITEMETFQVITKNPMPNAGVTVPLYTAPPEPKVPEGWADAVNLARNNMWAEGKGLTAKGERHLSAAILAMDELRLTAAPAEDDE